jgi:hypothetical protein
MARRAARRSDRKRTFIELDAAAIVLHTPDGRSHAIAVSATYSVCDAACNHRFVRLVSLETPGGVIAIITPPEDGAIAPRAAGLPVAPEDAIVVEPRVLESLIDWLATGARLGGRTIEELARLARLASAGLAVAIGEQVAHLARQLGWGGSGPMRGSALDGRWMLRPLEIAARDSERAGDALVAALATWPLEPV